MILDVVVRKKGLRAAVLIALFAPVALSTCTVPFRSVGLIWPDWGFMFLLVGIYGLFFRKGLFAFPAAYEWGVVLLVASILLYRRRRQCAANRRAALAVIGRTLLVYAFLRILVLPELSCSIVLYRAIQAGVCMVIVVLLLLAVSSRPWRRLRRSAGTLGAVVLLGAFYIASFAIDVSQVSLRRFEVLLGGTLGVLWWVFFVRRPPPRPTFLYYAAASAAWYGVALMGLVPDVVSSFHAYRYSRTKVHWVTRSQTKAYDAVSWQQGGALFVAQNNLAKYFPGEAKSPAMAPQYVGGQRLAVDRTQGRLYMPAFMRYSPEEDRYDDVYVYDLDLNLVGRLKLDECVGPLYVQYSSKRRHVYYSCEASGHLVDYDAAEGAYRRFGDYLSPNHIQLDEQEDLLYVSPIMERTIDVYDVGDLRLVRSAPVVPPVYVSLPDTSKGVLYVARFVLGDLETRDILTLKVLSRTRLDFGPRDMDLDRQRGRLLSCNYFTGTLSIVDLANNSAGRLFAGPRVRGLHFDPESGRLYFCSALGVGYYDEESLSAPYASRGCAEEVRDLLKAWLEPGGLGSFLEFLSLFESLARN